jgi:hypothetical protein
MISFSPFFVKFRKDQREADTMASGEIGIERYPGHYSYRDF